MSVEGFLCIYFDESGENGTYDMNGGYIALGLELVELVYPTLSRFLMEWISGREISQYIFYVYTKGCLRIRLCDM